MTRYWNNINQAERFKCEKAQLKWNNLNSEGELSFRQHTGRVQGVRPPPPPWEKAFFVYIYILAFKILLPHRQWCHSLEVHPLLRKILDPPLRRLYGWLTRICSQAHKQGGWIQFFKTAHCFPCKCSTRTNFHWSVYLLNKLILVDFKRVWIKLLTASSLASQWEAMRYLSVSPKYTTQWSKPGFDHEPFNPESSGPGHHASHVSWKQSNRISRIERIFSL